MAKIGRNAPCPCGSGKKYKKCCLGKIKNDSAPGPNPPARQKKMATVRKSATDTLIARLGKSGVNFDKEQFEKDTIRFDGAKSLVKHWRRACSIDVSGSDDDFISMAAEVLWERLAPGALRFDTIDHAVQAGYAAIENGDHVAACDIWFQVWQKLKPLFTTDMQDVAETDRIFAKPIYLHDMCQDLEMAFGNAGLEEDDAYYRKRIDYCTEFCAVFPKSEPLIMLNMQRAIAESKFHLGQSEQGEKLFQALIRNFPTSAWPYIAWGDIYAGACPPRMTIDIEKAKQIYQMGLNRNLEDSAELANRLAQLENLVHRGIL